VPRGFSDAIERATAKDRGDRQPTAGTLASELRAGLATPSGSAAPASAPSSQFTETVVVDKRDTNSDVNAPTILTVDAVPTSPPAGRAASTHDATVYEPAKPQPDTNVAATVVESAKHAETVTVPHVPTKPAPAVPPATTPAASKSKVGLLIGVVAVFVILLVAGVGGFVFWKMKSGGTSTNPTNVNTTGVAATAPVEVGRYFLELEPTGKPKARVAALVPIASGQYFKFHFTFAEDGYLYIVGPGPDKNQPIAFLTNKPSGTGVSSNKVSKGIEFGFPKDDAKNVNSLTLDKHPGTDQFTVIFAKTPLSSPSFLNEPMNTLTAAQQAELKDFISRYQSKPPVIEVDESNAQAPFMRVKAAPDQISNPIVFVIRIQHN
jgi:hypothetical protein